MQYGGSPVTTRVQKLHEVNLSQGFGSSVKERAMFITRVSVAEQIGEMIIGRNPPARYAQGTVVWAETIYITLQSPTGKFLLQIRDSVVYRTLNVARHL